MIILEDDRLKVLFPEVHEDARCSITFQRTLRIPDDGKDYPLPPGLGRFPLRHLDDHAARLPEEWCRRGGVITPMYQAEALWINFSSVYPFAVKVATGRVCAVSGDGWVDHLNSDSQDYVVLPKQPWLDGYCVEKGIIRQFVAMPLGEGYTVEEQLTGAARHGGVQIAAYPMKAKRYAELKRDSETVYLSKAPLQRGSAGMGLAPGGRMRQHIEQDPYGLDAWDQRRGSRCFVSIVNTAQWKAITTERPPTEPPTAKDYTESGLPWFEYYGEGGESLAGTKKFDTLSSVAQIAHQGDEGLLPDAEGFKIAHVIPLRKNAPSRVREGNFSEGAAYTATGSDEC